MLKKKNTGIRRRRDNIYNAIMIIKYLKSISWIHNKVSLNFVECLSFQRSFSY